jgi:hypothetical protein
MGNQWDTGGDDWLRRSLKACGNDVMRDIVGDSRRGDIHARAPMIPTPKAKGQQSEEPQDRSGWRDPVPLRSPEGIELVDRLVDQQDRIDAAARAHQMGLSYSEWQKLSEKDIANRKDQQAKKAEVKK